MSAFAQIDLASANAASAGTRFAGRITHFATIDSTNAALMKAAAQGAPEGTVYIAEEQTAGRGRGGHDWHSSLGSGLYVSVLACPPLPLEEVLWLSLATGLAAREAIRLSTSLTADIRWPNDLLIDDKKCGGILVESAVDRGALRHAVIGIGINVNHLEFPPGLENIATSLRIARGGEAIDRTALLTTLLRQLDLAFARLEDGDSLLLPRFASASSWVSGKRVHVDEGGGYTGLTAGLNPAGFLQVRTDDGTLRTVLSGGVRSAVTPTI